jgi:hypothetical protein
VTGSGDSGDPSSPTTKAERRGTATRTATRPRTTTTQRTQATTQTETQRTQTGERTTATSPPADDPVALNDRGFERIQAEDFAGAVPLLERSVFVFRANGRKDEMAYAFALFNLGQALNRSGRPADAIPYLVERLAISDFKRGVVRKELRAAQQAAGQPASGDDATG